MPKKTQAHKPPQQRVIANERMSIDQLRAIAETRGIMWGGLNKTKLIKKINQYN